MTLAAAACLAAITAFAQKPPQVTSPEAATDGKSVFRIWAPRASEVLLFGDWMGPREKPLPLVKGEDSVWTVTAGPLEPNIYTYGFLVDGLRIADPANYNAAFSAGRFAASLLHVRGANPWEDRPVPHGVIHIETYYSKQQARERQFYVYTPPGYSAKLRLPYLILLPGTPGSEADWVQVGFAHRIFDNLLADRRMRRMVVVMPRSDVLLSGGTRADNLREFEPMLVGELLPAFEARYSVSRRPESRAIAGYSLGGELAMTVGLRHPNTFAWIGSFSGSLFERDFASRFSALPVSGHKLIWVGCGSGDLFAPDNRKFAELLRSKGMTHTYHETPGFHAMPTFRKHLAELLPLLFR